MITFISLSDNKSRVNNRWLHLPATPKIISSIQPRWSFSGTVVVRVNKANFTLMYECRYTEGEFSENADWIYLPESTKTKMIISGLTLGRSIWVQVRCINGKGKGNWSDPAQLIFIH